MRTVVFATFGLLAAPLFASVPALAQGNPSTSQIIQSLKPSGNLLQGGTRGIRLVSPSTPAAPAASSAAAGQPHATRTAARPATATPPVAAAQPPATQEAAPSVSLNVDFPTNSAVLTPQAMKTLDTLGHALSSQDLATYRFRIEGHTDTVGSPAYNQALSQRRAEAVAGYLEQKFGIPTTRLQAVGMGEQGLLVMTPPQTAEIRNRRVEIVNIGA
ncbi:MAG TPA: OmpA family protein [Acetobacteraceae bacterium]|nr:OmpA family protein [Acetobacteraceae bacterium]